MVILVFLGAAALTLLTLLPTSALLAWRGWREGARGGAWRRLLRWHAALLAMHLFGSVPMALAYVGPAMVGTRGDERRYAGPRIATNGSWQQQTRESLEAEARNNRDEAARDAAQSPFAVEIHARDGVTLRGFLVPPARGEPRFTALLVHGLFRGALELETVGSMLRDLGGEVLLLELRRHGGSGGERFTYGRDEAGDVLGAVDWLRARDGVPRRPLVLFAVSIGTAAAAIAAPQIDGLAALILDAPLEDLRATTERMLAHGEGRAGSLPQPFRAVLIAAADCFGTIPFDAVVPIRSIAALSPDVPVLIIGAGDDHRMPPDTVRAYFAALPTRPDRKTLWIDPAATHGHVWSHAPAGYRDHLAAVITNLPH
ncbi:MAG: hypothetical protein EXS13_08070 [Planctomycetes bacterium]|nr:hypothetical protein [Planctomycetota bacterium]